ncbi:MAG: phosphatidylserine decarboxylase [Proteobacteria bacterium]|nr:phosphatidylserine decarboxylase [Pseudomonadota bacterium]
MQYPLKVWRQFWLPQHALTRFGGWLSHSETPWLKNYLINYFLKRYDVNMDEAIQEDPFAYPSYHEFFIRHLKPELRPIDPSPAAICSPCDGEISQIGNIEQGTLLQAKGKTFTVSALLGSESDAQIFEKGKFVTIYLAPKDYHRVHMPLAGTLSHLRYIPGKLFSVNPLTTNHIDNLFAKNERVVTIFKHDQGSFAIILVGAMIVGSIFTRWGGNMTPHRDKEMKVIQYPQLNEHHVKLDKGEEMGYFSLGSTVIVLLDEKAGWEYDLSQNSRLVVGQGIGHLLP